MKPKQVQQGRGPLEMIEEIRVPALAESSSLIAVRLMLPELSTTGAWFRQVSDPVE